MLEQWTWGEKQNKRKQQQKIVFQNRIPVRGDPHILIVGDPGLGKSQVRLIISWSVTVAFCNHSPWLLLIQSFCFRRVVYHAYTSCDFGWFRHHVLFKESDLQNKPFMWCALGKWFILQTLNVILCYKHFMWCALGKWFIKWIVSSSDLVTVQMLQAAASIAPRSVYVCGNTTTTSGLTVSLLSGICFFVSVGIGVSVPKCVSGLRWTQIYWENNDFKYIHYDSSSNAC